MLKVKPVFSNIAACCTGALSQPLSLKICGFDYSHFVKQNRAGMGFTGGINEGCRDVEFFSVLPQNSVFLVIFS